MDGGVDELGKLVIGIDAIRRGAVREMGRGERGAGGAWGSFTNVRKHFPLSESERGEFLSNVCSM